MNDKAFILTWPIVANTVVFLWISVSALAPPGFSGAPPEPLGMRERRPTPFERRALNDFGASRGISLREASRRESVGFPAYDAQLADRLEGELEQARTALSALEEDAAGARLARVEADLLAHPHLPQAAFLMAECLALEAALARASDTTRAAQLERDRSALEGLRARAFGEVSGEEATPSPHSVRFVGLDPGDQIEVDGRVLETAVVELVPGLHHVRVWRAGRPVFAAFERVEPGQNQLALDVPKRTACSSDDLSGAQQSQGTFIPSGIGCVRWALARSEPGGVGVALCERSQCGPFVHWSPRPPQPFEPARAPYFRVPSWALFALAGVAATAATSVVLWQAGAFDDDDGRGRTFRYAGVDTQGIRF